MITLWEAIIYHIKKWRGKTYGKRFFTKYKVENAISTYNWIYLVKRKESNTLHYAQLFKKACIDEPEELYHKRALRTFHTSNMISGDSHVTCTDIRFYENLPILIMPVGYMDGYDALVDASVNFDYRLKMVLRLLHRVANLHFCSMAHLNLNLEALAIYEDHDIKLTGLDFLTLIEKEDVSPYYLKRQPSYCVSPEFIINKEMVRRCPLAQDVWSIGVLVYQIMTGRIPWEIASKEDQNYYNYFNTGILDHIHTEETYFFDPFFKLAFNPDPRERATINDLIDCYVELLKLFAFKYELDTNNLLLESET